MIKFAPRRMSSFIQVILLALICIIGLHFFLKSDSTSVSVKAPEPAEFKQQPSEERPKEPAKNRVKAALVSLVRNTDLHGMRQTIREIEDRFNRVYKYPYIFLNDVPFTDEFKKGVKDLTDSEVSFGILDDESWGTPDWIDEKKLQHVLDTADYINGRSRSYKYMCRFQSGYIYKHPLLKDLEFYWRIEPDVKYYCQLDYDPFVYMKENNKMYGFNMAPNEYMVTIPTLWNTTKAFMKEYPQHVAKNNLLEFAVENGDYNGCHFWTNFEIVNLSFYRSKQYEDYFKFLDRAGGFFYERWGDAPVHTLAVTMFLRKDQVHYFGDIGYYHPAMGFCPKNSKSSGKCVCDPDKENEFNYGCRRRWDIV
ncbi:Glycolipid 2-alpha-mannosyltransferase [Smittium mucronatum]|uniref:Glycolipid 2-alpha-mannosyltransferase n=1 Tax=Smittium mucronatum TaxID=133383 RepID=A0A1R0GYB0_9FUNG|nr:Glycolipid 2-alpha-mannosyltransferase [Smittium mucronatum]